MNKKETTEKEMFRGEKALIAKISDAKQNNDLKLAFNLTGRLLNKYKNICKKNLRESGNADLSDEDRRKITENIESLNNLIINYRNELKELYKNTLKELKGKKNLTANTELRKKYIEYIELEIKELTKKSELNPDEKKYLQLLEKEYPQLINQYKKNLDTQYKDGLHNSNASLTSTFVALPKGCLVAIKKVDACIKDVRNAKNNKDKAVKIMNVVQATAELLITPILYLGKFAVNSILLITIGISLNLTGQKLKQFFDNIKKKMDEIKNKTQQTVQGIKPLKPVAIGKTR